MAIWHVWSGSGAEAANYGDWGSAAHSILTVDGLVGAGDTIYVAHDHSESNAGVTLTLVGGTLAAPIRVICGTRTGTGTETGISALATTAHITSTTTTFSLTGAVPAYYYGIEFEASSGSTTAMNMSTSGGANVTFEQCKFILSSTASASTLRVGHESATNTMGHITLRDCQLKFGNSSQSFMPSGIVDIYGLSAMAGGTNPSALFAPGGGGRGGIVTVTKADFSGWSSTMDIVKQTATGNTWSLLIRNSKMHASWTESGNIASAALTAGSYVELLNYGVGDTNYKFWTESVYGTCNDNTTVYRTTGAADESRNYSIQMTSTANVSWPSNALRSPPMVVRVPTTGSKTFTVHFANNTAALTNLEVWAEVEYLGTSGFPLALFYTDTVDIFNEANVSAQDNVGTGWTGSPTYMQSCDVTATVNEIGYAIVRVYLARPSTTIYSDFKVVVT